MVVQLPVKEKVVGSSPARGAIMVIVTQLVRRACLWSMIYEFEALQSPQYVFVAQIVEHQHLAGGYRWKSYRKLSVIIKDTLSWYDGSSNNWSKIFLFSNN